MTAFIDTFEQAEAIDPVLLHSGDGIVTGDSDVTLTKNSVVISPLFRDEQHCGN